ncbi:MAG: nitrite reductase small subunit NirD [Bacteroidota bacterium]
MNALLSKYDSVSLTEVTTWFRVAKTQDFPTNGGACVKYKDKQIAVFNFSRRNEWYACQNLCPHKLEMIIARGIIGDEAGEPKVACPLHKKTFSLKTGENLNSDLPAIAVYPTKVEGGYVFVGFNE